MAAAGPLFVEVAGVVFPEALAVCVRPRVFSMVAATFALLAATGVAAIAVTALTTAETTAALAAVEAAAVASAVLAVVTVEAERVFPSVLDSLEITSITGVFTVEVAELLAEYALVSAAISPVDTAEETPWLFDNVDWLFDDVALKAPVRELAVTLAPALALAGVETLLFALSAAVANAGVVAFIAVEFVAVAWVTSRVADEVASIASNVALESVIVDAADLEVARVVMSAPVVMFAPVVMSDRVAPSAAATTLLEPPVSAALAVIAELAAVAEDVVAPDMNPAN